MDDTDTALWPPPPLHPSVDVQEVGHVRLVRTEDRLTLSSRTKRSPWIGLLLSFLYVPFLIGAFTLMILVVTGGKAVGDGTLHRLFVRELWPHRLQLAYITVFVMTFSWFLDYISRNQNLFVFDKQRNMFQKHDKDFYPLSEAIAVTTTKTDGIWRVQIVRAGGDRRPRGLRILTHPFRGDHTTVFWSRKQEHTEQIAAILADFTGVPIQPSENRTGWTGIFSL